MTTTTTIAGPPYARSRSSPMMASIPGPGPADVLALSLWCGVAAGCLEVATRVLAKNLIVTNRLYMMSQHFVWVVPVTNLLLFCRGAGPCIVTKLIPGPGGWLSLRLLCAATILPAFLVACPEIYTWAWLLVAWGIAVRLVSRLQRPAIRPRRWLIASFPVLLACVVVAASFVFVSKWLDQRARARSSSPFGRRT